VLATAAAGIGRWVSGRNGIAIATSVTWPAGTVSTSACECTLSWCARRSAAVGLVSRIELRPVRRPLAPLTLLALLSASNDRLMEVGIDDGVANDDAATRGENNADRVGAFAAAARVDCTGFAARGKAEPEGRTSEWSCASEGRGSGGNWSPASCSPACAASATSSAASGPAPDPSKTPRTMSTACWFPRRPHTPSLATMINSSSWLNGRREISGTAITRPERGSRSRGGRSRCRGATRTTSAVNCRRREGFGWCLQTRVSDGSTDVELAIHSPSGVVDDVATRRSCSRR